MMDEQMHADDLIGAYVLGAVTPAEAALVEEHLKGCASCRQLERELREVEQMLPDAAGEMEPPPALKARLMGIVQEEAAARQGPRLTAVAPEPQVMRPRSQDSGLRRWSPLLAIAAVLVVAVVGFAAWRALTGSQTQNIQHLATVAGVGGRGDLTYDTLNHRLVLQMHGLQPIAASRVYELWLVQLHGKKIVGFKGVGVFRPGTDGHGGLSLTVATIQPYNLAGVTVERAPRSAVPHLPMVANGPIS